MSTANPPSGQQPGRRPRLAAPGQPPQGLPPQRQPLQGLPPQGQPPYGQPGFAPPGYAGSPGPGGYPPQPGGPGGPYPPQPGQPGRTLLLLINGVAVKTDEVNLFPGSYQLTSGNEYTGYGSGTLVVKHPSDYPNACDLRPQLTKAGEDAAKAKLTSCAKELKLRPAGCPFFNLREREGQDIDEKTIKRTIEKDPWSNAEVSVTIDWSATAKGRENGRTATFTADGYHHVTLRAKITEDPLKPVFNR